jgi:hypothetical protein
MLRQPAIKHDIVNAIRKNPKLSWYGIEVEINFWCSAASIRSWVMSRKGHYLYDKRVIPLLVSSSKSFHGMYISND